MGHPVLPGVGRVNDIPPVLPVSVGRHAAWSTDVCQGAHQMRATEARQQSGGNEEEARRRTKEAFRNYFAFSIAQVEPVKPQKVERVVERRTKACAALATLSPREKDYHGCRK
jgi:hypothetical protein